MKQNIFISFKESSIHSSIMSTRLLKSGKTESFCTHCNKTYCFRSQLRQHLATSHFGGGIPARPANLDKPIVGQTPYQELAAYKEISDEHRDTVKSYEVNKMHWKRINKRIDPRFSYSD